MPINYGNPFYVDPGNDRLPGLRMLNDAIQTERGYQREDEKAAEAEAKFKEAQAAIQEAFDSDDPDKVAEVMIKYPKAAEAANIWELSKHKNEKTHKNSIESLRSFALDPSPQNLEKIAKDRHSLLDAEGVEDRKDTEEFVQLYKEDPEAAVKMAKMRLAAIDPEWYQKQFPAEKAGNDTNDIKNWNKFSELSKTDPTAAKQFGRAAGFIKEDADPPATDISRYAELMSACRKGDQNACKMADDMREFKRPGVEETSLIQQTKDAAEAASKTADKIPVIQGYISNLEEVVRLLDEGADTGPIMDRLPTFQAASTELENIKNQLGLSVIQSATFGPLSEKELKFALDTALPGKLDQPQLKDWVKRKIAAQKKLLEYTQEAVAYLSVPGHTKAGWVDYQKRKAGELPEGLKEEDVQYNMDKYGKSRKEIIDKFKATNGGQ